MDSKSSRLQRPYKLLALLFVALAAVPITRFYTEYGQGQACARCHEIWQPYKQWTSSVHRRVSCQACHGDVLTLDAGFHLKNIRQLVRHLRGDVPEQVRLKQGDVFRVSERCRKCHEQEYADWAAGPHAASYAEIFLDPEHNRQRLLADDCLRCHGMHFEGGIRDLVTPLDARGPWSIKAEGLADRPAMPCLACHAMHREGNPLVRPPAKVVVAASTQELFRPSLALFDRRALAPVAAGRLSLPVMKEGERLVSLSPDPRQALCYQCHAPLSTFQVNSGDDRTAIGVHEGLSCFACHEKHGERTRASCANCHPRLSNCGLNVETMETTFKSPRSPHNIHFVKCADCHTKGVPKRKGPQRSWQTAMAATARNVR